MESGERGPSFQPRFFLVKFTMSSSLRRPTHEALPTTIPSLTHGPRPKATPSPGKSIRVEAGNGLNSYLTIQWCEADHAKDAVSRTVVTLAEPLRLTTEVVRGEKVESEITVPPGSVAGHLIPGGIFIAQELLRSGEFKYLSWEKRKPYTITAKSGFGQQTTALVTAESSGGINESAALRLVQSLIQPTTLNGSPRRTSSSEMRWSTFEESLGLHIGSAFFFMGANRTKPPIVSAEKSRYSYIYRFDQPFLTLCPDGISQPGDLFTKPEDPFTHSSIPNEELLYLHEVKYGRRLYVFIESEFDLEASSSELKGSLEWIVVSSKLQQQAIANTARDYLSIHLQAQDGALFSLTDYTNLQATVNDYFNSACDNKDLLPLSFKVSDLNGTSVALKAEAFLHGHHALRRTRQASHRVPLRPAGDRPRG